MSEETTKEDAGNQAKSVETTKVPAGTPVVSPQSNSAKPPVKKGGRRSCLIIGIILVVLFLFRWGPLFGAFWGGDSFTNIPLPIANTPVATTNTAVTTTPTKTTPKSTTKTTTPTTKTDPVPETNTKVTESTDPPVAPQAGGPQTSFTKQEDIDYFIKIAITDESQNYLEVPLKRWTKTDVKVKYFGDPNAADTACADQTLSIINSLSTTSKFNKTDGGLYDIEVHFVPLTEIQQAGFFAGYMYYNLFPNGALLHAYAFSAKDGFDDAERCHFIRHEMTHTVGLTYNLTVLQGGYHNSIFNVPVQGWSDYINIDKDLIKMMYNTGIPLKSTAASARTFLAGVNW